MLLTQRSLPVAVAPLVQLRTRDCKDCNFGLYTKTEVRSIDNAVTLSSAALHIVATVLTACSFDILLVQQPIIELSSGMKFGPFCGAYAQHSSHLAAANLTTPNLWFALFDFNDEAKTGKNWSLMAKDEVTLLLYAQLSYHRYSLMVPCYMELLQCYTIGRY
jgi:Tubulin binding cofactor C